ncbi:MAG: hypothetical protein KAQ65_01730 [Candidatus Thorarchaeota archaeon]|nr:hypothetical protein [Candidatus Thorarchaeota archaeon]MCK5238305.1 hypothetical protein [Candidatus Thorarchaeota archaeon]
MNNQIRLSKVWLPDGSIVSANLVYRDRPILILESGEEIVDDKSEITYEMTHEFIVDEKSETRQVPLSKPVRVYLTPRISVTRKYSKDAKEDDLDIYPPSSNGFYGRLVRGKTDALYILNKLVDDSIYWLTIIQTGTNNIYESHRIKPYEIDVIRLKTYSEHFHELISSLYSGKDSDAIQNEILGVIDTVELTWSDIHKITGGLVPPNFTRTKNNREILKQLVPIDKFVEDTQEEVLAFLIWTAKDLMPQNELVEFADQTYVLPLFRALFLSHLRFILDEKAPPSYSKIIDEVLVSKVKTTPILREERLKWNLAAKLRYQLQDITPDWQSELIEIVQSLNKSNEIITVYPIPKSSAKNHRAQRTRLLMWDLGLRLKAHIRPRSIGLREIVYVGAAHRWPHWHLSSSLRLGPVDTRSPYMQAMVMPPSAAERVKRVLPSVYDIEWSIHRFNTNLYRKSLKKWIIREDAIIQSFDGKKTLKNLKNEFGCWKGTSPYQIKQAEARLLDMANTLFYLSDLETKGGEDYWKTDNISSRNALTKLRDMGIIETSYWYDDYRRRLNPLYISLEGSESKVCSVTSSLIKNVPTALARIAEGGSISLVAIRIPRENTKNFIDKISLACRNEGLRIKSEPLSTHRNYSVDLYQRLLNADGSWNSDVPGLLSQIRSIPKSSNELQDM